MTHTSPRCSALWRSAPLTPWTDGGTSEEEKEEEERKGIPGGRAQRRQRQRGAVMDALALSFSLSHTHTHTHICCLLSLLVFSLPPSCILMSFTRNFAFVLSASLCAPQNKMAS